MFNIDILYISINCILLYIFCRMGWFITQGGSYKTAASICTAAFTLTLGSRYMRGNDYAHYVEVFYERTEADQHLFTWLNDILAFIGLNAYAAFYVYALIFSFCLFYFLRRYKLYATFTFPLSLIALIIFHESMIRQALSFSFIFLFLDQLLNITNEYETEIVQENKCGNEFEIQENECDNEFEYDDSIEQYSIEILDQNRNKRILKSIFFCILFSICALSIHTANIIIIVSLLGFMLLMKNRTIPFYISIPTMLFCALFLNKMFDLQLLAPYIKLLQGTVDKFDSYIEDSEYWFGKDGISDNYTRKGIILFCELWGYSTIFWLCDRMSKHLKFDSLFAPIFNTLIIGSSIMITFRELEILHRVGHVLTLLWFIPLSLCLYHLRDFQLKLWEKILLAGSFWWIYEYLKYLFLKNEGMTLFLWDINAI